MELIVWGSTLGRLAYSLLGIRRQLKEGRLSAGGIKPNSTPAPRIRGTLAFLGQYLGFLPPQLAFLVPIAYNGFRQPEWMVKYALPSPPDVFGIDGVVVGRAIGVLGHQVGVIIARTALGTLGDQYYILGVSAIFFHGLPDTDRRLGLSLGYR